MMAGPPRARRSRETRRLERVGRLGRRVVGPDGVDRGPSWRRGARVRPPARRAGSAARLRRWALLDRRSAPREDRGGQAARPPASHCRGRFLLSGDWIAAHIFPVMQMEGTWVSRERRCWILVGLATPGLGSGLDPLSVPRPSSAEPAQGWNRWSCSGRHSALPRPTSRGGSRPGADVEAGAEGFALVTLGWATRNAVIMRASPATPRVASRPHSRPPPAPTGAGTPRHSLGRGG